MTPDPLLLGLALARRHSRRGVAMSLRALAAFCCCSPSLIWLTERRALAKLRAALTPDLAPRVVCPVPARYRLARAAWMEKAGAP